uniref:Uncharacterized protein n=1 Tax=Timema shepardi TaxID=629360 RepID=A0A7R9B9W1_TIMSH|nr:unnamed protein product [Timema shepardi]
MRQNANRDPPEVLELKIKSLTDRLQNTTKHQDDYVQALIKYKDGYRQQYKSGQERFDRKMTSLARRIKITEEEIICFMDELTTIRKESKEKEIIWIQEKDKLVQELESCKKRSGKGKKVHSANPWVLQKLQDKVDTLENQLIRHDKLMAAYKTQCKELKVEFGSVKHQLDVSHDEAKEKESKMAAEIKHYKTRIKDLERRFCLEGEGYKNDVKRLNERLKSLEKQYVKKKVPHFK